MVLVICLLNLAGPSQSNLVCIGRCPLFGVCSQLEARCLSYAFEVGVSCLRAKLIHFAAYELCLSYLHAGADALFVHILAANEAGRRFYTNCGFTVDKIESVNEASVRCAEYFNPL